MTAWRAYFTYVFGPGKRHNFVKRPPAVILANGISFLVAHMVIRGHQDANGVGV